ncbi:MAG: thioredoxin-dependent thiol peroxidase [Bacteroidia bacterium]|nr:thioredoxin-dependent thiol peroxidase [Bacteroidia bacterium]
MAKKQAKKSAKKPVKKAAKKAGAAKKSVKKAAKKTASKAKKAVKKVAKKATKKAAKKVVKKTAKKVVKAAKKTVKKVTKKATPKKAAKVAKKVVKAVKKTVAKKAVKKVIKKAETPVVDAFKSAVQLAKKVVENVVAKVTDTEKHVDNTNENSGSESSHTENSGNDTPSSKDEEEPSFVAHKTHLNAGDTAPYFEGRDQNGNALNLTMFKGKNLILYFYPQDDTPTCTKEACNLRDEYKYLSDSNYAVVGVSPDDERSHTKFIAKYNLPFPLLADTDMSVIKAYDVWGTKKFMGRIYDGLLRTTFVIGPDGIIKEVITKVDSANHAQQILGM